MYYVQTECTLLLPQICCVLNCSVHLSLFCVLSICSRYAITVHYTIECLFVSWWVLHTLLFARHVRQHKSHNQQPACQLPPLPFTSSFDRDTLSRHFDASFMMPCSRFFAENAKCETNVQNNLDTSSSQSISRYPRRTRTRTISVAWLMSARRRCGHDTNNTTAIAHDADDADDADYAERTQHTVERRLRRPALRMFWAKL